MKSSNGADGGLIIDDDNFSVCANQADETVVIEPIRGASSPNSATSTGMGNGGLQLGVVAVHGLA
jgi:hypothetical protein